MLPNLRLMLESILNWDLNTLVGIQQALNADSLTAVMKAVTLLGENGFVPILVCLILILNRRTRRLGILCGLSLGLAFLLCNGILKPLVNRARPWEVSGLVNAMLPPPGDASFPSGHTNSVVAVAWAMWITTLPGTEGGAGINPTLGTTTEAATLRRMHNLSKIALALAVLVGFSRLYLGMHFPTDVIGGIVTGIAGATAVYVIDYLVRERAKSRGA